MLEFKLPDVGEGLHEAEVLRWLVQAGEAVRQDQPMVEIQTDKAVVEISSPVAGTIAEIRVAAGARVPVGTVLVAIATGAPPAPAAAPHAAPPAPAGVAHPAPAAHGAAAPVAAPAAAGAQSVAATVAAPAPGAPDEPPRILAAPSVRKAAREMGVDIAQVPGSGPGGRVTLADLQAWAARAAAPAAPSGPAVAPAPAASSGPAVAPAPGGAPAPPAGPAAVPVEEVVPLAGLRRRIAERLSESWRTVPHVTTFDEVDAGRLAALRQRLQPEAERRGVKLTFLPLVIKAVTTALKEHPYVNATYDEAGGRLVLKRYYHIGVATAVPDGLLVPVIRDADRKNILTLAAELQALTERARARTATQQELTGSTFTITNFGSFGGWQGTPIINPPEVAILGVGRVADRVVARDGQPVVRPVLPLSFSFDHRVLDGEGAGLFTRRLAALLADPELLLLELA